MYKRQALLRIHLIDTPLERDEGEYAYAGQLMLQGIPPYQLACNMKLPGTYAAYALILAAFGQTIAAIHAGLLLVNAGAIVLIYLLGRRLYSVAAGLAAGGAYALLSVGAGVLGTQAHATHFVVLAALGGVLLLLRYSESGRLWTLWWSGLLFGLAFLMKQHGIFFGIFGAGYLAATGKWKKLPLFLAGAVTPFGLTCLILWRAGVFGQFWSWTFTYASHYVSENSLSDGAAALAETFGPILRQGAGLWALAAVGLMLAGRGWRWGRRCRLPSNLVPLETAQGADSSRLCSATDTASRPSVDAAGRSAQCHLFSRQPTSAQSVGRTPWSWPRGHPDPLVDLLAFCTRLISSVRAAGRGRRGAPWAGTRGSAPPVPVRERQVALGRSARATTSPQTGDIFVPALLLCSFAAICPGLYFRAHYVVLMLPAVALLAGSCVRGRVSACLFAAALVVSVVTQREFLFRMNPVEISRELYGLDPFPEAIRVGAYIRGHTAKNALIAVLGSEPEIYFYAHRHSATSFLYTEPLVEPQPFALRMQNDMVRELERAAPAYVVRFPIEETLSLGPGSPTRLYDWWADYGPKHYQLVGIADILPDGSTVYRWDAAAEAYRPQSLYHLAVYRRM